MRKLVVLVVLILLSSGCAVGYKQVNIELSPLAKSQVSELYNPVMEKGFCLHPIKGVSNVLNGGPFWSDMPLCNKDDFVMHTHPVFCEPGPNFIDGMGWDEYGKRYGNEVYGVVGIGGILLYKKEE